MALQRREAPVMLKAVDVSKHYQTQMGVVKALDRVNLAIREGEYLAAVGHSGSGKTTLLSILAGLERPTKGAALFRQERLDTMPETGLNRFRQTQIGFVFQHFYLVQHLTALENVMLPLGFRGLRGRERVSEAERLLASVGVADRGQHFPRELSGGQQQRVAIARAIANKPLILFADEPTGNLDEDATAGILDLFDRLHEEGLTIIVATHAAEFTERVRRIVRLRLGQVVADSP